MPPHVFCLKAFLLNMKNYDHHPAMMSGIEFFHVYALSYEAIILVEPYRNDYVKLVLRHWPVIRPGIANVR